MNEPTVSILCATYNHAGFIRQAMDGFLMQEAGFDFEVLVNDDCSTDGTREILREYAAAAPGRVKLTLQESNLYQTGFRGVLMRILLPLARGKYVALCEGDDYWTDPGKLAKQVAYMEAHPGCALCFHPVVKRFEGGEEPDALYPAGADGFTLQRLMTENFIQTNSVLYRRLPRYDTTRERIMPVDWYLHLYHAHEGEIGFLEEPMAVYRVHEGGIWHSAAHGSREAFVRRYGLSHLRFFLATAALYADRPNLAIYAESAAVGFMNEIITMCEAQGSEEEGARFFSELFEGADEDFAYPLTRFLARQGLARFVTLGRLNETEDARAQAEARVDELQGSRSWKLTAPLRRMRGG